MWESIFAYVNEDLKIESRGRWHDVDADSSADVFGFDHAAMEVLDFVSSCYLDVV